MIPTSYLRQAEVPRSEGGFKFPSTVATCANDGHARTFCVYSYTFTLVKTMHTN